MKYSLALLAVGATAAFAQSGTSTSPAHAAGSSSPSDCPAYCQRDAAHTLGCSISDLSGCYCTEEFAQAEEKCYSSDACTTRISELYSTRSSLCASIATSTSVASTQAATSIESVSAVMTESSSSLAEASAPTTAQTTSPAEHISGHGSSALSSSGAVVGSSSPAVTPVRVTPSIGHGHTGGHGSSTPAVAGNYSSTATASTAVYTGAASTNELYFCAAVFAALIGGIIAL